MYVYSFNIDERMHVCVSSTRNADTVESNLLFRDLNGILVCSLVSKG